MATSLSFRVLAISAFCRPTTQTPCITNRLVAIVHAKPVIGILVPKLGAIATSLDHRSQQCLHWIVWPRKLTPRIKQRVGSCHTSEVISLNCGMVRFQTGHYWHCNWPVKKAYPGPGICPSKWWTFWTPFVNKLLQTICIFRVILVQVASIHRVSFLLCWWLMVDRPTLLSCKALSLLRIVN